MNDFSIVLANLFRAKLRTSLMLVAIFFAFLIFGVLAGVQNGWDNIGNSGADNRLVTTNKINFTQPLPISYIDRIRAVEGVEKVTYANWFGGFYQEPRNVLVTFAVDVPTYLDIYRSDFALAPAAEAAFLADRTAMVAGATLAEKNGWKVGDKIPLNSNIFTNKSTGKRVWDFTLVGLLEPVKEEANPNFVLFHHKYFNESVTFGQNTAGYALLRTVDKSVNAAVAEKIDAMFANSPAETATDTEKAFNKAFASQLGNITLIILLVVGSAFFTILMIVGNTMVMAVRERTREIGVMKTLGFRDGRIFRLVLGESLLLALLGGLPALGLAAVMLGKIRQLVALPGLELSPPYLALGLLFMLALGLITGLIPAWKALRLNIVTALGRQ